jgi:XTP/dITP diphosphohydrolase
MQIVFGTSNPHKVKELNGIVKAYGIKDVEFILPPEGFDPDETGTTFEENSLIKAQEASKISGMISLADDSGLCVEVLNGEPGIYSARYAETPQKRIDKLLAAVAPFENRRAKFVCAMTLTDKDGNVLFADIGECHGKIAKTQAGTGGFGYDPIFLVDGKNGLTMAELSENEKNEVSHRGNALRKVLKYLSESSVKS